VNDFHLPFLWHLDVHPWNYDTKLCISSIYPYSSDISIGITCRPNFCVHDTPRQLLVPLIVKGNRLWRSRGWILLWTLALFLYLFHFRANNVNVTRFLYDTFLWCSIDESLISTDFRYLALVWNICFQWINLHLLI